MLTASSPNLYSKNQLDVHIAFQIENTGKVIRVITIGDVYDKNDLIVVSSRAMPLPEKAKAIVMLGSVYVKQTKGRQGRHPASMLSVRSNWNHPRYIIENTFKPRWTLEAWKRQWSSGLFLLDGSIYLHKPWISDVYRRPPDCMLQNGAAKVYSVDVGQGQFSLETPE